METIPQTYKGKPLLHAWTYRNPDGETLGIVGRYQNGTGKDVVPFFKCNGSGWQAGALDEPRPLYGLDVLNKAEPSRAVLVVEGEKCAAALHFLDFVAVASPGGSKAADKTDWKPLEGHKRVYLLPDNDSPGQGYIQAVAGILSALDSPPEVSVIELPGLPDAGDVVDWIQERLPDWNGLEAIKEREPLASEFMQAVKECTKPVPGEWLSGEPCIAWGTPGAIEVRLKPVPALPEQLIPEPYRKWILDIAHRMQTPPDFAAVTAITVTASVIGTACAIRPKQRDNWTVIPNLWGACIGRPSVVLKSPSMKEPLDMLARLQAEAGEVYEEELRSYDFEKKLAEIQAKDSEKAMAKAVKEKNSVAMDILRNNHLNAEDLPEPVRRLFKMNETSIQSQTVLQTRNPRGLLTFRDEITGLLTRWDKRDHEDERAYFLEGWNGDGSYTDFKIGRGLTEAEHICISLFGGIQPDKLRRYLYQSMNGGNDGLVQRFQLAVYPDEPENWQLVDEYPDTEEKARVYRILRTLADMDFTEHGAEQGEYDKFPFLRFSSEGQRVFNEWLTELQKDKLPKEESPLMAEHLGKYRSLMPTLALIIHLIGVADGTVEGPVSRQAAIQAAAWCEYLEEHAQRIYGIVMSPEREAASILAERIHKLPNPFTAKDAYDKGWHLLRGRQEVEAACRLLEDEGWLRMERVRTETGRPPLPQYWINPAVRGQE